MPPRVTKEKEQEKAEEAAKTGSGGAGTLPGTPDQSEQLGALLAMVQKVTAQLSEQQVVISSLQAAVTAQGRGDPQEGGGQASQHAPRVRDGDTTAHSGVSAATPDSSAGGAAESVPVTLADLRTLLEERRGPSQRWLKPDFSEKFDGDIATLHRWSEEALSYLRMHRAEPAEQAIWLANQIGKDALRSQVKLGLAERPLAERTPELALQLLRAALGVDPHTAAIEATQKWLLCRQRAGETVAEFAVRYKEALLQGQPDLQPATVGRFASLMFVSRLRPALLGAVAAGQYDVRTIDAAITAATREEYHMSKRQLQEQRRVSSGRQGRFPGLNAMGIGDGAVCSEEQDGWCEYETDPPEWQEPAALAAMQSGGAGRGFGGRGGGGRGGSRGGGRGSGRGGGGGRGAGPAGLPDSAQPVPGTDGVVHPNVDCRKCKSWGHFQAQCPRDTGGSGAATAGHQGN